MHRQGLGETFQVGVVFLVLTVHHHHRSDLPETFRQVLHLMDVGVGDLPFFWVPLHFDHFGQVAILLDLTVDMLDGFIDSLGRKAGIKGFSQLKSFQGLFQSFLVLLTVDFRHFLIILMETPHYLLESKEKLICLGYKVSLTVQLYHGSLTLLLVCN